MDKDTTQVYADPFTYTLSYMHDFYYMCEMSDRSILIQKVDETTLQFDARFKDTRNCYSYSVTLSPHDYRLLKHNNCDLRVLKIFIEQCISRYLINYLDEPMVTIFQDYLGNDVCRQSYKTSKSVAVETHVHYFKMEMSRFNSDDYLPHYYNHSFVLDSEKKQIYRQKDNISNFFKVAFDPTKFTSCKISIYDSITNDDFKCIIDNGLMGTILCYSNRTLSVYDNTFGSITHYEGDYDTICATILDIIKEVVVSEPSEMMTNYAAAYGIDLATMTSEQLKMFVIAAY